MSAALYRGGSSLPLPEPPPPPREPGPMAKSISLADTPQESTRLFTGGALLISCLLVAVTMGWGIPGDLALALLATPSHGVVVSNAKGSNRINRHDANRIVFRYEADGKQYEGAHDTIDEGLIQRAAVGKPIELEVVRAFPHFARIKGEGYSFFGYLPLPAILLLGVVGMAKLLPAWGVRRRRRAAFRRGQAARGRITGRNEDAASRRVAGAIEYEYAVGERTYIGSLWGEKPSLTASAFPRDEIIVFYDPRSPSSHAVWIEDDFEPLEG